MIRLFVGLDIDPLIRRRLSSLGHTIPGARAVPEDQIHLTLRFIGEVDGATFIAIREGLEGLQAGPLTLCLKGTGHFPPRGAPRVIWTGVEPAGDIIILRNRINRLLGLCGVEPEARKFHPHVTLARLKEGSAGRVAAFLSAQALLQSPPFRVDQVHLFSSVLHARGAIHRIEASYPLTGG